MKVQINMVAKDSRKATDFYEELFGAKVLSKTDLEGNVNEGMLVIGDVEVKILDENQDYGLVAPSETTVSPMWLNLYVEDIDATYQKAMDMDCLSISPVTEFPEHQAKNAVFKDPFNFVWILNNKK